MKIVNKKKDYIYIDWGDPYELQEGDSACWGDPY